MIMLGTHKPQQQATLTKIEIPEYFFHFRFRTSTEKILNPEIRICLNSKCFCEDDNRLGASSTALDKQLELERLKT